ncbi:MAG TPA: AI-2E family transporter [Pyrinomonadaceae bacterium]|nr:AI-2E family transporter [Pyrinomonadaceae bacterium]
MNKQGKFELISPFWWLRWVPAIVVSLIVIYFLYAVGKVVIIPVLASFALAYLLNPLVYEGEKRGLSRIVSSILAIVLVGFVITAFLAYVVPDMWAESAKAGTKIAEHFTPENAVRQRAFLKRYSPALERVAGDKIEKFLSNPLDFYDQNLSTTTTLDDEGKVVVTGNGSLILLSLVSSLDLALVPFFVFYILIDFHRWRDSLEELIPPRFRHPFSRLFDESGRILESYVRGQLLIGLIMAVCYAFGFWALGVPAWAGIALLAGLLNAIPYVGTILGIVLASAFTLAEGGGMWDVAGVLGIFAAVQAFEGYVLTPKILGGRLNLHPMAVFLGLLVGGKLFGLIGIVLAIPAIAIGKVFLKFVRELYQASHFYHGGDIHESQTPAENIEELLAEAAETVLAEQVAHDVLEEKIEPHEAEAELEEILAPDEEEKEIKT